MAILATKAELKTEQDKLLKLQAFDSSPFRGKSHFEEDGTQNYLVFQPMYSYFKRISNTDYISQWKSKGLSDEIIKPPTTSDNSLAPALNYNGNKTRIKFTGSCLKQAKIILFNHKKMVNIYMAYEISVSTRGYDGYFTLENCLFGAVKLTKNADIDKYKYSRYGIGFDRKGNFSFPSGGLGCNIIIFYVDMSSSVHIDNKKKEILILGEGPTQGLDGTALTEEKNMQLILL